MYFEITQDEEVIRCNMKDNKIIEVPITFKNDNKSIIICGISLLVLGIGIILYGKKKK